MYIQISIFIKNQTKCYLIKKSVINDVIFIKILIQVNKTNCENKI